MPSTSWDLDLTEFNKVPPFPLLSPYEGGGSFTKDSVVENGDQKKICHIYDIMGCILKPISSLSM